MQRKTIQKVIVKNLEAWLESITDVKLRNRVKPNILLSGGSITSLFQCQDVNDYDIYIKDVNVLWELATYYTCRISGIEILDGRCLPTYRNNLESDYRGQDIYTINNSYAIAVRTLKPDQIKIFFKDGEHKGGMKIIEPTIHPHYETEPEPYQLAFLSPNAISLTNNIQIILRFHGDNEAIHKTFDFIHATNYFTFETGLVTNVAALESIITKQLAYQGSLYPLTSIIRMKKFLLRGWSINAGEILKIMFQISELDLKNPDVLEEQLIGVDVAYFGKLIEVLRGADNQKFTSQYLNEIIDRVFNQDDSIN